MPQFISKRARAWILPLAGLGLILYANVKTDSVCHCGGESPWFFYWLSFRLEPNEVWTSRAFLLQLALGAQMGLCLLIANNKYLTIGIVLAIFAILIAPDLSLFAENRAHPFTANQWQDALSSREARAAILDFFALFINLATALYRANGYVLSRI